MSFKSLIIVSIFLVRISAQNCSKIRLIQPLDESTGLSYVILTAEKYYMITKEFLDGKNGPITPLDLPRDLINNYDEVHGIMLYFNKFCSSPQNYLIAYKV